MTEDLGIAMVATLVALIGGFSIGYGAGEDNATPVELPAIVVPDDQGCAPLGRAPHSDYTSAGEWVTEYGDGAVYGYSLTEDSTIWNLRSCL